MQNQAYSKHLQSLKQLYVAKKPTFDIEAPYQKKKRNVAYSKPNKERQFIIEQENGALIHKMIDVKKKDGEYSKSSTAPKSLFLPLKVATEKKVNSENIAMTMRLRNANSTINFKTFDKNFAQNIKYKSNITNRSRRIYNCFLLNGSQESLLGKSTLTQSQYQQTGNMRYASQDDKSKLLPIGHLVDSPPKKQKKNQKQKQSENNKNTEQQPEQDLKQQNQNEEQIVQDQQQPANEQEAKKQDQQKQSEENQDNNQNNEEQKN